MQALKQLERTMFAASAETRLLYQRICTMQIGDTVTYGELDTVIGCSSRQHSSLARARIMAQRDRQIVTAAVKGIGIRRLSDSETVQTVTSTMQKMRRAANRGIQRAMSLQDFDALSASDKTLHNAAISAMRAAAVVVKPKSIERLMAAVNTLQTGELPVARTLELFKGPPQK